LTCLRPAPPGENANRAVTARFLETAGFGGATEIRFARDPFRSSQVDGNGVVVQPLSMAGDAVLVEYSGEETIRVLFEWD